MNNLKVLEPYIRQRIDLQAGELIGGGIEFLHLPPQATSADILKAAHASFRRASISLVKQAGIPIPDDIKEKASKALVFFERAQEVSTKSMDMLQKNLTEYEKIQDDSEAIFQTKGQYNNSIKRNIRTVKRYLGLIRNGLEIMDQIKDISTTQEIMDTIIRASKSASDGSEEVFKTVHKMESPDFYLLLSQQTQIYQKLIEDLHLALKRMIDYINADIKGVVILSD
jgi:hypothetical protein